MKLLCWNVHGMNSASKRAVMKELFKSYRGECLFIQETKMESNTDPILRLFCPWRSCQYAFCPSIGASGGILLVWNAALWQKLDEFVGRFTVSVRLKDARCDAEWVATSVYGPANVDDKEDLWVELNQVAGMWNRPWLLGGDFNVVRFLNKRKGGCSMSASMWDFNNWIRFHDLCDLPLRGAQLLGLICKNVLS